MIMRDFLFEEVIYGNEKMRMNYKGKRLGLPSATQLLISYNSWVVEVTERS